MRMTPHCHVYMKAENSAVLKVKILVSKCRLYPSMSFSGLRVFSTRLVREAGGRWRQTPCTLGSSFNFNTSSTIYKIHKEKPHASRDKNFLRKGISYLRALAALAEERYNVKLVSHILIVSVSGQQTLQSSNLEGKVPLIFFFFLKKDFD